MALIFYPGLNKSFPAPKYPIGTWVFLQSDHVTPRQVTNAEMIITLRPSGKAFMDNWRYDVSDPSGGCGPIGESELLLPSEVPSLPHTIDEDVPSKGKRKEGYVYLLSSVTGAWKIGRTISPKDRRKTFGVLLPFEVEFECLIETRDMFRLEAQLQEKFATKRINGEWFALAPEDVDYVKGLAT